MLVREKITINGIVQGVGFRPFVYTTARKFNLTGFVCNSSDGVIVEVQGDSDNIRKFHHTIRTKPPSVSVVENYRSTQIIEKDESEFVIKASDNSKHATTFISPDLATCNDCLQELFDKNDRRFKYPFINCTNCGPRYSIVESIPYDREYTSMRSFQLCDRCSEEYNNPSDRRFHAQPNACPVCGPRLFCHDGTDIVLSDDPIKETLNRIAEGQIVAVKGIGGFHLAVDPFNNESIKKLRIRKNRAEKPFALMVKDIQTAKKYCFLSPEEEKELTSTIRPIVLLKRNDDSPISEYVAPYNNYLGIMLAYSPLHHILLHDTFDTLIMTSANISDEPIAIENDEAIDRLQLIADFFLLHDRPILQRCDDSIVRIDNPVKQIIRRARGYAPKPITYSNIGNGILALGGDQKNCISLSRDNSVFYSQYIGDLENPLAYRSFKDSITHLSEILEISPSIVVCDMHPGYYSTKYALQQELPVIRVQHHHAHMVSVMAENRYYEKVIGIILDGSGYGTDETVWGGEVLVGDVHGFSREAYLKPVPLPGSSMAVKEPYRMAYSYLHSISNENLPSGLHCLKYIQKNHIEVLKAMIEQKVNTPMTSSCGRLFDAVSSLLNIRHKNNYDAQAAIELEMIAQKSIKIKKPQTPQVSEIIDVTGLIEKIIKMLNDQVNISEIALYFHYALAEYFIAAAKNARAKHSISTVALSGGVYQNKVFFEYISSRLKEEKFKLLIHAEVPVNDGGLPLGQTVIANAQLEH